MPTPLREASGCAQLPCLSLNPPVGSRQPFRPGGGARRGANPVLTDLDQDARQAAALAVHRYRVVDVGFGRVRLVVPDAELATAGECLPQQPGEATVAPKGHTDGPRAHTGVEDRREAVDTEQY